MIHVTPSMRVFVATEPADFRKGIDGLAAVCRKHLQQNPMSGALFVFRNRRGTAVKLLLYDGQGFRLCQKRLCQGRFRFWPSSREEIARFLESHQLHVLLSGGDPDAMRAAPPWRRIA